MPNLTVVRCGVQEEFGNRENKQTKKFQLFRRYALDFYLDGLITGGVKSSARRKVKMKVLSTKSSLTG